MSTFPIQAFAQCDTPFYYYDVSLLSDTLGAIKNSQPAGSVVHYALKANSNRELLRIIACAGLGADCVSGGEVRLAIEAGFAPSMIVYAGVGKSDAEIRYALEQGISCFNVESQAELDVINELAAESGQVAPIALRINPHVDAHTHHYITTGMSENKFGIDITAIDALMQHITTLKHVRFRGLHFHIGSQIMSLEPFEQLCSVVNELLASLSARGIAVDYVNVGGGLGVDYAHPHDEPIPPFAPYFATFSSRLQLPSGATLHFELGRSVVCQCGSLFTRVLYIKEGVNKRFAIVDAGMTDLLRPALYQAQHRIENVTSCEGEVKYEVVGPICESSDSFGEVMLPITRRGDLLVIRSAGAYGESMAMQYNARPLPHYILGE